jgi:hypothetical protein
MPLTDTEFPPSQTLALFATEVAAGGAMSHRRTSFPRKQEPTAPTRDTLR